MFQKWTKAAPDIANQNDYKNQGLEAIFTSCISGLSRYLQNYIHTIENIVAKEDEDSPDTHTPAGSFATSSDGRSMLQTSRLKKRRKNRNPFAIPIDAFEERMSDNYDNIGILEDHLDEIEGKLRYLSPVDREIFQQEIDYVRSRVSFYRGKLARMDVMASEEKLSLIEKKIENRFAHLDDMRNRLERQSDPELDVIPVAAE